PLALAVESNSSGAGLEWNASSGAATYTVLRAPAFDGPYVPIKSGLAATKYLDNQAPEGETLYYAIVAQNKNGTSYPSMKVASFAGFAVERSIVPGGSIASAASGARPGGAVGETGAPGAAAAVEEPPIEADPFVLEGNTEDGVPDPPRAPGPSGPKPPAPT
ncbi:MAG TPA: hypothetical protein VF627_00040, partial [Abditibacterium sp.]